MLSARTLYYRLSPAMRFFIRKLYYFPSYFTTTQAVPPKALIYTGRGDFLQQGKDWQAFFVTQGLQPQHRFLDIGSGIGRIALGLTSYLTGEYQGFEAIRIGVDWCEKNISKRYPNFHFTYEPLHNDLYNSNGIDAATYEFPYAPDYFDMAVAISVFSHMIDTEVENYVQQCVRVLRQGGTLIGTFFLIDEETKHYLRAAPRSEFQFAYDKGNYLLMDEKVQGANVCFKKDYLYNVITAAGFTIEKELRGSWCGRPKTDAVAFQDVLVLRKRQH